MTLPDLKDAIRQFNADTPIAALVSGDKPPRLVARKDGGEYAGPCPLDGGNDRFHFWPAVGRWWCRGCQVSGDALDLAVRLTGVDPKMRGARAAFLKAVGYLGAAAGTRPRPFMAPCKWVELPADPAVDDAPVVDWAGRSAEYIAAATAGKILELADLLGVSGESLRAIGCGWFAAQSCWTFPEHDGRRRVVGISRRWRNGRKMQMAGSRRGLTIPADLDDRLDPVLVVEGQSSTAAALTLGHAAVGRPSSPGGAVFLAELLRHRDAVLVGERDQKPSGDWPGLEGANSVAQTLAAGWGRPVPVMLPPAPHKDLREWLIAQRRGGVA